MESQSEPFCDEEGKFSLTEKKLFVLRSVDLLAAKIRAKILLSLDKVFSFLILLISKLFVLIFRKAIDCHIAGLYDFKSEPNRVEDESNRAEEKQSAKKKFSFRGKKKGKWISSKD